MLVQIASATISLVGCLAGSALGPPSWFTFAVHLLQKHEPNGRVGALADIHPSEALFGPA
jgi:hypothetical protein